MEEDILSLCKLSRAYHKVPHDQPCSTRSRRKVQSGPDHVSGTCGLAVPEGKTLGQRGPRGLCSPDSSGRRASLVEFSAYRSYERVTDCRAYSHSSDGRNFTESVVQVMDEKPYLQ